jgi:hypothetical protein
MVACSGSSHREDASAPPPPGQSQDPTPGQAPAPDAGPGVGSSGTGPGSSDARPPLPPVTRDHWTFWSTDQGLSRNVEDVSADEAGNVYVAGGDAVYAKRRDEQVFHRFDAVNAGLTKNCYDVGVPPDMNLAAFRAAIEGKTHPNAPGPAILCPVVSVAGGAPGVAAVGFRGLGTDGDYDGDWATDSGGMDMVKFDATTSKLTRVRHVLIATPPHHICGVTGAEVFVSGGSCPDVTDPIWAGGRRKLRQVLRIAINHDVNSPMYGDVWMGGTHATFAALINNAASRGWVDLTADQPDPKWADAKDVWEHDHPGIAGAHGEFLTGEAHALSIDPQTGRPWGSNGVRTGWMEGYGPNVSSKLWWIGPTASPPAKPWIDLWPDSGDPLGPTNDNVMSLSHCPDRSVWVGSYGHGLAHLDAGGGVIAYVDLPDPARRENKVSAVACDPSDGSVWIGLGNGGIMRLNNGRFTTLDTAGLPDFTNQPPYSIQIDRWVSPRIVYFAHVAGARSGGGVSAYDGP